MASGKKRIAIRENERNNPLMNPHDADKVRDLIREGINKVGANPTDISYEIGRGKDYIRDFISGKKQSIGAVEIIKLQDLLKVNLKWALGTIPQPDISRVLFNESDDYSREYYEDDGQGSLVKQIKDNGLQPGEIPERNVIAGLGQGGTGETFLVDGEVLDGVRAVWRMPVSYLRIELRAREADLDIVAVDGDSMTPTLLPGDRVVINRSQKAPSPDGLYAIFDGIGISIKRLELQTGSKPLRIRIISDNPQHGAHDILAEDLTIIGRVVMKMSRL